MSNCIIFDKINLYYRIICYKINDNKIKECKIKLIYKNTKHNTGGVSRGLVEGPFEYIKVRRQVEQPWKISEILSGSEIGRAHV